MNDKMKYVKPELKAHGSIEEVTQGGSTGDFTDAAFPVNTPRGKLTFS
jgi:hypothetical protein